MDPIIGQIILFGGNFAPRGWAMCNGQLMSIAQNSALFSLLGTMYGGDGQNTFALPDLRGRAPIGMGQGPGLSNIQQGEKAGTPTVTLLQTQMPAHQHLVDTKGLQASLNTTASGTLTGTGAFPAISVTVIGDVAIPVNTVGGIRVINQTDPSKGVLAPTAAATYASAPTPNMVYSGSAVPVTNGKANIPATNVPVSGSVSVPIQASAPITGNAGTTVAGGSQPHDNMSPYLGMNYCIALEGIYPSRQ
jgi:microcystin-dependent protein